jgi:hypothetical protein
MVILGGIDQLHTFRENRSTTTAKYNQLSCVRICVYPLPIHLSVPCWRTIAVAGWEQRNWLHLLYLEASYSLPGLLAPPGASVDGLHSDYILHHIPLDSHGH